MVELNYQLIYQDYVEAVAAHTIETQKQGRPPTRVRTWLLVIAVVSLIIVATYPTFNVTELLISVFASPGIRTLMPWMALLGITIAISESRARSKRRQLPFYVWLILTVLTVAAIYLIPFWALSSPRRLAGISEETKQMLYHENDTLFLDVLPWGFVLAFGISMWRITSASLPRAWRLQTQDHHPKRLLWDETHLIFSDNLRRIDYSLTALTKLVEAEHLFLVYINPLSFHMIPKRAFGDEQQIRDFRDLITNMTARIGGFPVVPVATRA